VTAKFDFDGKFYKFYIRPGPKPGRLAPPHGTIRTMETLTTPLADGFRMPAEWEPQAGIWMIWPERPDNWRLGAKPAQAAFTAVANAIVRFEPVTMLVSARQYGNARQQLPAGVRVLEMSTNDSWCRDVGASFLVNGAGELRGVDWPFNAWGGLQDGMYFPWDFDDAVAQKMLEIERAPRYRAPIITEGGALHVDGQGTVLVTEACLLNENRNPGITREHCEDVLKNYLGAQKIIWLGAGVPFDETGGHVDNIACFTRPGTVLLTWCDEKSDPLYEVCRDAEARLTAATDAQGNRITVEKILMPAPMFITEAEAAGVDPSGTAMTRHEGERLAASYVNFLIVNGAIIAPAFGTATDAPAQAVLKKLFPEREVVMLPGREILLGGGNIHCITQQQPKP
jgi:agmatine deiminase